MREKWQMNIAGFLAVLIVGAGLAWYIKQPRPSMAGKVSTPALASAASAVVRPSQAVLEAFNHAESLRDFYDEETKLHRTGAWAYRHAIISMCRQADWPPTTDPDRMKGVVRMDISCGMGEGKIEQALQQLAQERASASVRNDVVVGPVLALQEATTEAARRAAVSAILANSDPMTLGTVLVHEPDAAPGKGERVFFDGRWYQGKAQVQDIDDAYKLAACELGFNCTGRIAVNMRSCVYDDWCGSKMKVSARWTIDKTRPGHFAELEALSNAIVAAMKARRVDAFVPPAAPTPQQG